MRPIILLTVMAVVELSGSPDRTKNLTGSNSSTRTDRRKNRNRHCRDNMSSHSRRKRKCPPRTHEDVDDDTGIPSYIKPMSPLKSAVRAKVVTERKMLKRDWCKAQPLRVEVSHPGCRTRKIINKYCYGQCNSFFIPNSDQGQPVFASCSYCKPHKTIDKYVTLTCPESSRKKVQKKVTFCWRMWKRWYDKYLERIVCSTNLCKFECNTGKPRCWKNSLEHTSRSFY